MFYGAADDHFVQSDIDVIDDRTVHVRAKAVVAFEQYACLVVDGLVQSVLWVASDQTTEFYGTLSTNSAHTVSLVPMGDWDQVPSGFYPEDQQSIFITTASTQAGVEITPALNYVVIKNDAEDTQLSAWSLTGLARYWTGSINEFVRSRLELTVDIANVAGVYTVSIYDGTTLLCQGSRATASGSVTLTAQDADRPVSGTVALNYTGDLADAMLLVRYPASFNVYVDTVLLKSVALPNNAMTATALVTPLAAGTHDIQVAAVSDTGVTGALSAAQELEILAYPEPPSALAYLDGNWTNTRISFTASPTPGATYRVYASELDAPVVFENPITSAGSPVTLASLAAAGTGTRRVVVESYVNGVESGFRVQLNISYVAGVVQPATPNVPASKLLSIANNNTMAIYWSYGRAEEQAVATKINLYVSATPASFSDWATPAAQVVLDAAQLISSGTFSKQVLVEDNHYFIVRTETATGVLSPLTAWTGPIWLSSDAPSVPTFALRAM